MKKFSVKALIALLVTAGISFVGLATPAYATPGTATISVTSFVGRELTPAFTLSYSFTSAPDNQPVSTFYVNLNQLNVPSTCTSTATTAWSDCGVTTFSFTDANNASVSTTGMTVERGGASKIIFRSPTPFAGIKSADFSIAASTLRATAVVGSANANFHYGDWDLNAAFTVTTPTSYSVTFDSNGGSGTMANQSTNAVTALSNNTYTRSGYTFGGWATSQANATAGTVAYANGANYDFLSTTTLYAIWTEIPAPAPAANGLANTGFSAIPYLALGSSMILFGLSFVLYPRRRESGL